MTYCIHVSEFAKMYKLSRQNNAQEVLLTAKGQKNKELARIETSQYLMHLACKTNGNQ